MPDKPMTDDEMTVAVLELTEKIGPVLHGQPTEIVTAVLVALLGDVLNCFPRESRLEFASQLCGRALRFGEKLEQVGSGQADLQRRRVQ